jgi:hypothetical protein
MSLDTLEQHNLKGFLLSLYGPQVNSWPMNDDIFDLTYVLLQNRINVQI